MDPFLLPVHNVQETSEGHRGLGEGEGKGAKGREMSPRSQRLRPHFERTGHALGVADHGLVSPETACQGKSRQVRRRLGGAAVVGSIYCKAEQGKPEDVQNKRRDYFAASEVAGTETL